MKKTISAICLFLISATGYVTAQTTAGNMMIGGNVSLYSRSHQNDNYTETSYFNFSPQFGYFVADNFAIGAMLEFDNNTMDQATTKTKVTGFSAGPFVRYYKFTSNEKFAFFGQAAFTLGSIKRDETPGGEEKGSDLTFSISPGFSYFLNEHWALDLSLSGFTVSSTDPNKDVDDDKTTYVQFGLNSLYPSLGIRYHFGGK